jgi:hypothetical protein
MSSSHRNHQLWLIAMAMSLWMFSLYFSTRQSTYGTSRRNRFYGFSKDFPLSSNLPFLGYTEKNLKLPLNDSLKEVCLCIEWLILSYSTCSFHSSLMFFCHNYPIASDHKFGANCPANSTRMLGLAWSARLHRLLMGGGHDWVVGYIYIMLVKQ